MLGVPYSGWEPPLHQLLICWPAGRQALSKRRQAEGEIEGQVVPHSRLVAVTHHLEDCSETCSCPAVVVGAESQMQSGPDKGAEDVGLSQILASSQQLWDTGSHRLR